MRTSFLAVPLDGSLPFLIEGKDHTETMILLAMYAKANDHWVIDSSDNTFCAPDENGDLQWYDVVVPELEETTLSTAG